MSRLVGAGGNTSKVLETADRALYAATTAIEFVVEGMMTLAGWIVRDHRQAAALQQELAGKPVRFPSPNVIGSDDIATMAEPWHHVVEHREVLIETRAGIDDGFVGLETFIVTDIPEQRIMFLDEGDDLLARRRGDCANNVPAAVVP